MTTAASDSAETHEFVRAPHRTFLGLAIPVLLSLAFEPLTGLADTAFVARLGVNSLAALGISVTLLASAFWVFNFLGIGTQTAVAQALGRQDLVVARAAATTSSLTALVLGVGMGFLVFPWAESLVLFMGAREEMIDEAVLYLRIRLLSAPAVLLTLSSFGTLRGLQDMRTPFRIAVSVNILNVILDGLLIFGFGPIPSFGLPGAAWATVASQWLGALWAVLAARSAVGGHASIDLAHVRALFVVGRDLVARTALLLGFLLLTTRAATHIGPAEGAAQLAVRQSWVLAAFLLDAFAASAQSLVGYFIGAGSPAIARRVARVACQWGVGAGASLALALWLGESVVAALLVPRSAEAAFVVVWWVAVAAQPLNALAFVTDGIHWGTGDYRYLRNVMLLATILGSVLLASLDLARPGAFFWIWIVTDVWIAVRAFFGILRVWPGFGAAPLGAGGRP